jgi:predicted Zn-dependent peptidase
LPAPSYPLVRTTLENGLRVVLAPDRSAPVVGVAVYYDVGIRSEPEGRTGFAHLFEHLMFQGSANLEKLEHFRYVQSSGGTFNGSTHLDYTRYYEVLPSNALERGLFLEADRMRSPRITEENLANQIAVVKEEIRVNVLNRPYGGFPWIKLPPVAFQTFANAHNGYGDFVDLENSTVADAADFFDRYYAPANAVLTVAGDLDPDEALALIERHFADIPARPAPKRPSFAEPDLTAERRKSIVDNLAPMPAVAVGWRVPDPVGNLGEYLPYLMLGEVLSDGDSSRLEQRLVQRDRTVTQLACYLGMMGDPFDVRDPTVLVFQAHHAPTTPADTVLNAVTEETDRLAQDGLLPGELDRIRARLVAQIFRDVDPVLGRTLALAAFEQQHGRADLLMELPGRLAEVTEDQIRAAAASLRADRRATLELVPGAKAEPSGAAAPAGSAEPAVVEVAASPNGRRPARATRRAAKATPAKATRRPAKAGAAKAGAAKAGAAKAGAAKAGARKAGAATADARPAGVTRTARKAGPAKAGARKAGAAEAGAATAGAAGAARKAGAAKAGAAASPPAAGTAKRGAAKAPRAAVARAAKAGAAKAGAAKAAKAPRATVARAAKAGAAKAAKAGVAKATPARSGAARAGTAKAGTAKAGAAKAGAARAGAAKAGGAKAGAARAGGAKAGAAKAAAVTSGSARGGAKATAAKAAPARAGAARATPAKSAARKVSAATATPASPAKTSTRARTGARRNGGAR